MKNSLNICFHELSEEFRIGTKNQLELAMVNEPSVFELLRFNCINTFIYIHVCICLLDF